MHIQETADSVTSSVAEILTFGPQFEARQSVELSAVSAIREDSTGKSNMSLEDARIHANFVGLRLAKVMGPGDVRCSIQILPT